MFGLIDDILCFEYMKKNNKDSGLVFVGIEFKYKEDYYLLINCMDKKGFFYIEINKESNLFYLFI